MSRSYSAALPSPARRLAFSHAVSILFVSFLIRGEEKDAPLRGTCEKAKGQRLHCFRRLNKSKQPPDLRLRWLTDALLPHGLENKTHGPFGQASRSRQRPWQQKFLMNQGNHHGSRKGSAAMQKFKQNNLLRFNASLGVQPKGGAPSGPRPHCARRDPKTRCRESVTASIATRRRPVGAPHF